MCVYGVLYLPQVYNHQTLTDFFLSGIAHCRAITVCLFTGVQVLYYLCFLPVGCQYLPQLTLNQKAHAHFPFLPASLFSITVDLD